MDRHATCSDDLAPAQMAEACGVSVDTLRYYEHEGLLDHVDRTDTGQRRYSADDVAWVRVLRCLRVTAMPIRQMKAFADLVRRGDDAIEQRLELLREHRTIVERKQTELDHALKVIEEKIATYSVIIDGTPSASTNIDQPRPTINGKGIRS